MAGGEVAVTEQLMCTRCHITINPSDWTNNNITQTTQGLIHKNCPISDENKSNKHIFRRIHDFDTNGIIYWLGTNKGTSHWLNPEFRGKVIVTCSSLLPDSEEAYSILGIKTVRCATKPQKNSWFMIQLKDISVIPTHYSLKHYATWNTEALRNWILEGYSNGYWDVLSHHKNDKHLNAKGSTYTWKIGPFIKPYSTFRIKQFDVNSNNHHYLALSGFELYGKVIIENKNNIENNSDQQQKLIENLLSENSKLQQELNENKQISLIRKQELDKLKVEGKKEKDEQQKLIENLLSENTKLRQKLNENKQISLIRKQELDNLKHTLLTKDTIISTLCDKEKQGNGVQQKLIGSLLSENGKSEQNLMALNRKLKEKENEIKKLQTEYYKLQINQTHLNMNKNDKFKVLQSKLEQTQILIKAYQNENVKIKKEYQILKAQLTVNNDEKKNDNIAIDKCKKKFVHWLCVTVKLPQYLPLFSEKEYNDIRMIEFFDNETMENEIGIQKGLHRKLLLKKSNEFKLSNIAFCQQLFEHYEQLKQYKQIFEVNGILTMDDLKKDVKNKQELKNMLNINDLEILNLLWSIIYPKQNEIQSIAKINNEGQVTQYL